MPCSIGPAIEARRTAPFHRTLGPVRRFTDPFIVRVPTCTRPIAIVLCPAQTGPHPSTDPPHPRRHSSTHPGHTTGDGVYSEDIVIGPFGDDCVEDGTDDKDDKDVKDDLQPQKGTSKNVDSTPSEPDELRKTGQTTGGTRVLLAVFGEGG